MRFITSTCQTSANTPSPLPPDRVGTAPSSLSPFESIAELSPRGKIDELVLGKLKRIGIKPARICSDAVFGRRVYLDVIGTLPTAQEAKEFLQDHKPNKRRLLIDRLLQREEFADYWAMKWCDLLRVKSEFPINLWPNAVQTYHHWIRASIRNNVPYDRFVREILTASGSNFRVPPVNFYRAVQGREPQNIAHAVALTFMGARAEKWPKGRLAGMAAFFSQIGYKSTAEWKEEIVLYDPGKPLPGDSKGQSVTVFPDGAPARLTPGQDPRRIFADWLISARNPWFARSVVNRIWYWLMGRGIIHEPDDLRFDNPPQNPELLAYLERELVTAHYDLKAIFRLILNSGTYQLSSITASRQPDPAASFACYPLRRLEAEVLIDALNQITGATETYSSPIPEPFTFLPEGQRAISLADGSITSSFLEMFGRPARDTGMASERNNGTTSDQELHLLNSSHIQRKLERGPNLSALTRPNRNPKALIEQAYLTILSRFPTEEERKTAEQYSQQGGPMIDLVWALINSAEFLYRH